jgi:DNA helicase-2/ATP-dependent DNA helicase PcrA
MRLVLEVEGKILDGETFAEALERYGERDLRRRALGLFEAVDAIPVDDGEVWLNRVHVTVERCLTLPANKTIKQAFRKVALDECVGTLGRPAPTTLRWATIHEAKGRDYDAVCLVVPRPRKPLPDVVDLWEAGVDDEALRVLYVGATRAKRLLALAIEADDRLGRVRAILDKHAVPHEAA